MGKYYSLEATKVVGPYSIDELKEKNLKINSLLCKVGSDEWKKVSEFPELSPLFDILPPPRPPQQLQRKANFANAIKIVLSKATNTLLIIFISLLFGIAIGFAYFYNSQGNRHLELYNSFKQQIKERPDIAEQQEEYWSNITDGKQHPASWSQSAKAHWESVQPYKKRAWNYALLSSVLLFASIIGFKAYKLASSWVDKNSTT